MVTQLLGEIVPQCNPPDPSQSAQEFYVWSFPGCPLRVQFQKAVIERLAAELGRTAGSGESGGILLGEPGPVTKIVDFQPIPSDPPSLEYRPSVPSVRRRFEHLIGQVGAKAVGYYRFQSRGLNQLSSEDLALIDHFFTGFGNVHLVMGATEEGPNMAGVFFRESRVVQPISYMEFACDPHALRMRPALGDPASNCLEVAAAPQQNAEEPILKPSFLSRFEPKKHRVPGRSLVLLIILTAFTLIAAAVAGFSWARLT